MIRIIEVNNLNDPGLEPFAHLNENQLKHYYEPYGGLFIGESPNVVLRALDAGYEPVSVLMERKYIHTEGAEILEKLGGRQTSHVIPVYVSTLDVLSKITGYHLTRGILCAFRRKPLPSVEEVCCRKKVLSPGNSLSEKSLSGTVFEKAAEADRAEKSVGTGESERNTENGRRRIVVLENIENPTNVGAIFRSAAALNMDGILLTPECADPLYRRAVRVSVGTVFQIPWTYIGRPELHYTWMKKQDETGLVNSGRECYKEGLPAWPDQGMRQLHELGFRTAAMALRNDTVSIDDPRLRREEKLAVILGNEGEGLLPDTITQCDYTIRIPMSHGVDSLNVAAASAVAFWELGRDGGKSESLPTD